MSSLVFFDKMSSIKCVGGFTFRSTSLLSLGSLVMYQPNKLEVIELSKNG